MNLLNNRYSDCYFRIVERARARGKIEGERHHVIPVSLGGTNVKSNLVWLTLKEHFVCHLLLLKMTEGLARKKMSAAFVLMSGRAHGEVKTRTAKMYALARQGLADRTREQWKDPAHRANVTAQMSKNSKQRVVDGWVPPWKGKTRTEEFRLAQSARQTGKPMSEDALNRLRADRGLAPVKL